jgi:surfactin synthase thioesterase subunit
MDTGTLIRKCTDLGGLPHIFQQEPELLESFLNGLRADLKALEQYTPPELENAGKLTINASVLYSDRDYIVDAVKLREWEYYVDCSEFIQFPGDHFYLFDDPNQSSVAQVLTKYLRNDKG